MTPGRLIKLLASVCGVLIILWLAYLYTQVPHRKAPYAKVMAKADRIALQRGSVTVELFRDNEKAPWKLMADGGSQVSPDPDRVKTLMSALSDLQLEEPISDRADRAGDFEVTPQAGTRVTLTKSKQVLADGFFGKQAPDYSHIYFRFVDAPTVYLAQGVLRGELGEMSVGSWRNRELITLPDAQVESIILTSPSGSMHLVRSSDTWTLDGLKVDPAPVYGLVGAIAHLRADDFVSPVTSTWTIAGLSWGSIEVKTQVLSLTLHVGAEDPVTRRYPAAISAPVFAWLSENKVQTLFPKRNTFQPAHAAKPAVPTN